MQDLIKAVCQVSKQMILQGLDFAVSDSLTDSLD